jgi:hypothetical protein
VSGMDIMNIPTIMVTIMAAHTTMAILIATAIMTEAITITFTTETIDKTYDGEG